MGKRAITVVSVVNKIGRKRRSPDRRTASRTLIPSARARLIKSTMTSESLTTTPVSPIVAYNRIKAHAVIKHRNSHDDTQEPEGDRRSHNKRLEIATEECRQNHIDRHESHRKGPEDVRESFARLFEFPSQSALPVLDNAAEDRQRPPLGADSL